MVDEDELKKAIEEKFYHRQTRFDNIVAFEKGFAEEAVRINRWNTFIKKKDNGISGLWNCSGYD